MKKDFSKYFKSLGAGLEQIELLMKFGLVNGQESAGADSPGVSAEKPLGVSDSTSSLTRFLGGTPGGIDEYYFPPDLIGGSCPRVHGEEEDIVWNSAAEACDSERVHVVWHAAENKVWYIAVRSADMASHAQSWCPFAALLPGMKDAKPAPVCYAYYADEMATLMTVTADALQIYRGTSLIVRAKAERTARELGNVPIVELVPDQIMQLTPVPWFSLSLFEDRARRILAAVSVFAALIFAGLAFLIWISASLALIAARHDLSEALMRTQTKTMDMMRISETMRASPMREQIAKFADLNDGLLAINGFLEVYEIKDDKTRWRAVIPSNITADRINELGGKTIETTAQGVVIGNAAEIEFEATTGKK